MQFTTPNEDALHMRTKEQFLASSCAMKDCKIFRYQTVKLFEESQNMRSELACEYIHQHPRIGLPSPRE